MNNTQNIIKSIRDIMRKDTGVDGDAQRISQMVWMLFMKIFSDKEPEWKLKDKNYKNPIPVKLRWQNWASDRRIFKDDSIINFINRELFPTLKKLEQKNNEQAVIIRSVFEDTYNYMKNGSLFRQVIQEIDKIDFSRSSDSHVFNEIYETILKELQSAGSSGEYYTPRTITRFMVDVVDAKIGQSILDPACGTGGFLTCAAEYLQQISKRPSDEKKIQQSIQGIEKKPLPHLLCTTNLMLHGFNAPLIRRDNLLAKPYENWNAKNSVDIVLTNPPFGGIEETGIESNFPVEFRTKETADLFVVLIIKLLKKGGKAAIVLPDNFLFGEGVRTRIKEHLLTQCNLHTIVRLPKGVFSPYTGIKTNLLFFEKGKPTKEIWYYEHPLPIGQSSYSKSRPLTMQEFEPLKNWWQDRKESDTIWKVSINDIKRRNFNLDISSPYFDDQEQMTSKQIIDKLEQSFKKNLLMLSSLKLEY